MAINYDSIIITINHENSYGVRIMAQAKTRVLTAHVPLQMAEKVDQMAARLERSRGWIMKQALSSWLDQQEERSRLTQEALADVDAGHVIDHQAVQAWADSLDSENPLSVPK
jgi:predicted transcriptional regulator